MKFDFSQEEIAMIKTAVSQINIQGPCSDADNIIVTLMTYKGLMAKLNSLPPASPATEEQKDNVS